MRSEHALRHGKVFCKVRAGRLDNVSSIGAMEYLNLYEVAIFSSETANEGLYRGIMFPTPGEYRVTRIGNFIAKELSMRLSGHD